MNKLIINILLVGYLTIGTISITLTSLWLGTFHFLLVGCSVVLVSYSYCSKCTSCQKTCGHPQIGIIRKIMPKRQKSKYQIKDYMGLVPLIIVGIIVPQYWLWQDKVLFGIFWVLNVTAAMGIITKLCVECENTNCVLNRNKTA